MLDALVCILIADFITGFIHRIEDTYGVPSWPLLGKSVIEPNIRHHEAPTEFTMASVLYRNYQVFAVGGLAILIAYLCGYMTWHVVLVAGLAAMGNEIHAWSHKRPKWTIIRLMQDMKLLISPEQHAKHHRKPYNTNYCTITNWLNPVLEVMQFWRTLECILAVVGIKPYRCSVERRGY